MKKVKLVKNAFETIISVPKKIWDKFSFEKTVNRTNVVRNGAIATALVAALSGGVSSTALAEENSAIDNGQETTMEQTYEEPVVEMTITEEPTYEEPVFEQMNVEVSTEEQSNVTETSAEQMNVEVSTEEQSNATVTSTEQVNSGVSENEQCVEMTITENTSSQEISSSENTSTSSETSVSTESKSESYEQTISKEEVSSGESYETTETEYTTRVAFTVVEKNGVPYIFTDAKDDEESQKLLSQKINEWMEAHYGSSQLNNHIYSISRLGVGTQTVGDDNLVVSIDEQGNVSIIDNEVTQTLELDSNLEIIDVKENENGSKEEIKKDETKTESKITEDTKKETKTENQESTQINTRTVSIADDDYIIITGKDGSVTIGYKYILGAKGYAEILKSLNLPADVKVNTPILLPTKSEEGIAKKNSMTAGGITISTEDGINYVLSGDGVSDVKLGKDSTKQLDNAADKSKNGHLDGDEGKPNHDVPPTPENPPKEEVPPTPENPPKKEVPPTPNTPNNPTPNTPNNPTPNTPNNPKMLPRMGDDFDRTIPRALATLGVTLLTAGIGMSLFGKKLKLVNGGAACGVVEKGSLYEKGLIMKQMNSNGFVKTRGAI